MLKTPVPFRTVDCYRHHEFSDRVSDFDRRSAPARCTQSPEREAQDRFIAAPAEARRDLYTAIPAKPRSRQWPGGDAKVEDLDLGLGRKTKKIWMGDLETKKGKVSIYSVYGEDMKDAYGTLRVRPSTGEYRFTPCKK
ncbi:MAG: hypothetical protein IT572_11470 [Deltaproteobacteria bacterium]|nr:hypothetical protein [Deltaproteobacteria bacterium]